MITIALEGSTELIHVNIDNPGTDVICPIANPGAYKVCLITLIYEALSKTDFNLAKVGIDSLIEFQKFDDNLSSVSDRYVTQSLLKDFAIAARSLKTISNLSDS